MAAHDRRIVAERAAQAGADVAEAAFRRPLEVGTKANPSDFVTDADRNAQEAVLEVIQRADPDATVVAEEGDAGGDGQAGSDGEADGPGERSTASVPTVPTEGTAWIVDPIDGTRNYVAGSRIWATSVAAVVEGETAAAATLMPAYGDDYALGSDGVTRNGAPVGPSEFDDPLAFSVAPLGWWPREERGEFSRLCEVLGDRFGDVRRYGCAQAVLAMVASGELDAAVATRRMNPWDAVAGAAMVERAGGTVSDPEGEPWRPDAEGLVVSNGEAHGALVEAARDARDGRAR